VARKIKNSRTVSETTHEINILKTQKATILDDFSFVSFLYREGSFLGASLGQKPNGSGAGQTRPSIPPRGPKRRFVHTIDR
jgi:hypothetical protein